MRIPAFMLAAAFCGCGESPPPNPPPAPFADAAITAEHIARWSRTCALCHANGEGGAPRIGDAAAWTPRLAQGEDVLLAHTLEGFNNMPPLGYCMDCEGDDFRALIRFMATEVPPS